MAESIASLNIRLVADIKQYDAEMQAASRRAQLTANGITGTMGKVGTRVGLGLLGVGTGAALVVREIKDVVQNIQNMPGVPPETVGSVLMLRQEFAKYGEAMDRAKAATVAFAINHARNMGVIVGGWVYGKEAALEAANQIAEAAKTAYQREPAYIEDVTKATKELTAARAALHNVGQSRGDAIASIARESAALSRAASAETDPLKRAQKEIEAIKLQTQAEKDLHSLRQQFQTARSAALSSASIAGDPIERVRKIKTEVDALNRSITALNLNGSVNPQQLEQGIMYYEALAKKNREFADAQRDVVTSMQYFREAVGRMYESVGDRAAEAFGDVVLTGKASFGELANVVARSMIEIVARMAVINPLMNAVFGLSGSSILPAFFGKGAIKTAASGNSFRAGEFGMVGENGPELVKFNQASQVISNTQSRRLASGKGGAVYNIDARGADQSGLARLESLIRQLDGSIERRSLGAMFEAQRRGYG